MLKKKFNLLAILISLNFITTGCSYKNIEENVISNSDISTENNKDIQIWDKFALLVKSYETDFMSDVITLIDGTLSYEETITNLENTISKGVELSKEINELSNLIENEYGKEAINMLLNLTDDITLSATKLLDSLETNNYDALDNAVEEFIITLNPILTNEIVYKIDIANSKIRNQEQKNHEITEYDATDEIVIYKKNYRNILDSKNNTNEILNTSKIEDYLKQNFSQNTVLNLIYYKDNTIRLKANYLSSGYEVHLPRIIMVAVKEIEKMGYPIKTLEVEFYTKTLRSGSYNSILLYKKSNLSNVNIYIDELGYVKAQSFYKGAELSILNESLFNNNSTMKALYDYYLESN